MSITLVNGRDHNVIKRDGRVEPFSWEKLDKVLLWAATHKTNIKEPMAKLMIEEIKKNLNLRIYDKIKIEKLFDELIDVSANLADRMYSEYDLIARNLYIQKIYKETWGIKRNEYPNYKEVIKKGLQYGIYGEAFENLTEDEIDILDKQFNSEYDFLFNSFLGITTFHSKYCKKYSKTKFLELPQHAMMRLAINSFYNDPDRENKIEFIIKMFDIIRNHYISRATPYYLNAGTKKSMLSSCVLTQMQDDSYSINKTCNNIGMYSREGGGTACDVSPIRSVGAVVDKTGRSSGKIPFIKMIESVISAYNQKSARNGACAVYFDWWDYEIEDLIMLKDEGGSEDRRARKLQYAVKINNLFIDRIINNEEITLFDPYDAKELLNLWGEEFEQKYIELENKTGIRKKKIKARDLAYLIAKIRNETGNLYIFFTDNANAQTPHNRIINSSNLCTEVMLSSTGPMLHNQRIIQDWNDKNNIIIQEESYGEIALCNLSAINIMQWINLNKEEKEEVSYLLLRAFDNEIDSMYYPVKEAEIANKLYRNIGIGVNSLASFFASKNIKFTDNISFIEEFNIMEDISYNILKASVKLAKERGKFIKYYETKWKDGWLPIDRFKDLFNVFATTEQKERWELLREDIKEYGVRFATHFAIAPGATSSLFLINGTESTEPVKQLVATKTGTYTCKQFVPNIKKWGMNYQLAWEIPNEILYKHAVIRQMFLDQAQSINSYTDNPQSAYETIKDIINANKLGLKSLYYLNMKKGEVHEACENCSS